MGSKKKRGTPRPVTDPLWGRRRRAFWSSPTPPRVAYPLDAHVPPAVWTVGGRILMGHPHNRVLLPAHLHHPQPGLHRGRYLDRRLLQPPLHPHQPRRQIPPSKTNDTKRPGRQPHRQTVNNLHTGPDPNYTPNYEEPQKMSQPWEFPPVFTLIRALELGYVNDYRRLSDNELHAARGADARPHTGAIPAAP